MTTVDYPPCQQLCRVWSNNSSGVIQFNSPKRLTEDLSNNPYLAVSGNQRIRKLGGGAVITVAGNGFQSNSGDGSLATLSSLNNPRDVCIDSVGNLFIADNGNFRVREVAAGTESISTVAGVMANPTAVALDMYNIVHVAETGNH